jgi:hypothetical protein
VVNPGWADLDRGLFSISVAAELAGLRGLLGDDAGPAPQAQGRPARRPAPGG